MSCPTCQSENPEVAAFCHRCGTSQHASSGSTRTYAVQSSEGVNQFAVISTIMPHSNRETADNYRWAMIISAVLVIGATALGLLPIAIAAAAFLVPITYLVYIYDVNLWEDAPAPVVAGLFLVTGALAALVSLIFFDWVFADEFRQLGSSGRAGMESFPLVPLLIFAVLLPVVAELVKNLPGVLLARMPQFDDMIDGLTFGVAAGTAYAAFETIVLFRSVFTSGDFRTEQGLATWVVVIINLMVVKSLIYGTASGIAVAAFSGKGEGYDGFTPFYVKNLAFAMVMNVLYWVGVRLAANLPYGQLIGLLWGFVVLVVLVIRIRVMMQAALLEAAVEAAAKSDPSKRETLVESFCPECENMLLAGSHFCIVCGTSVRSTSRQARSVMTTQSPPADGSPPYGAPAPDAGSGPTGGAA
ncbi:PrsW family glutamic-type intramembrane protease [Nocardioides sp.]|uniref:PrsW family glutamic-type intramembrane protease n=1 Tax=Nocardioides sp. TaxID=35761 RepID=UPI00286D6437|nr:PrsW family glutamic-type intramembrane protease [Nocardioides sp.]